MSTSAKFSLCRPRHTFRLLRAGRPRHKITLCQPRHKFSLCRPRDKSTLCCHRHKFALSGIHFFVRFNSNWIVFESDQNPIQIQKIRFNSTQFRCPLSSKTIQFNSIQMNRSFESIHELNRNWIEIWIDSVSIYDTRVNHDFAVNNVMHRST